MFTVVLLKEFIFGEHIRIFLEADWLLKQIHSKFNDVLELFLFVFRVPFSPVQCCSDPESVRPETLSQPRCPEDTVNVPSSPAHRSTKLKTVLQLCCFSKPRAHLHLTKSNRQNTLSVPPSVQKQNQDFSVVMIAYPTSTSCEARMWNLIVRTG